MSIIDWEGDVYSASEYLEEQGYTLSLPDLMWQKPTPEHVSTPRELSAVGFLIRECDYGGVVQEIPGLMDWLKR